MKRKAKFNFMKKTFWGVVEIYNELNRMSNDELANTAIKYHYIC